MTNARDKANIPVLNFQSKGIDDNADATAITIDSSERVGLNTTTPGAKIEINSTGSYYNTANQHQQWSYNGTPFLSLYMDAYASPYFDTDSASSWNPGATMVFKRQGSEKFRITNAGSVGIGTSAPSKILHVSSNDPVIRLTDTDTGATHNLSGSSSARNFDLEVDTGSTSGSPRFALKIHDGLYYTQTKSEAVFNEESNDVDFRIESDNSTHALFVQGSNGHIGINTSSLTYALNIANGAGNMRIKTLDSANVANASTSLLEFHGSNNRAGYAGFVGGDMVIHTDTYSAGDIKLQTNGAERMRLLSNGRICINRTSSVGAAKLDISHPGSSEYGLTIDSSNTSGTQYHLDIRRSGTQAGYLVSTSATAISLANASDERLKENIENSGSAIQDIKDLKVRQFDWKDNIDTHKDFGFVAQELHSIIPEAVAVGSDELDDNGKPKQSWGVDYSHIVPRLVKAVQEQQTKIESLEAEVTALKNQP